MISNEVLRFLYSLIFMFREYSIKCCDIGIIKAASGSLFRLKIVQDDVSGSTHSACGAGRVSGHRGARGSEGRVSTGRGALRGRSGVAPLQPVQVLRTGYYTVATLRRSSSGPK